MQCDAFEDRLLDYAGLRDADRKTVDAHLASCAGCRLYLETVERVDRELERAFNCVTSPDELSETVLRRARTPGPSMVPELLDGIGWLGVLTLLACLAFFVPGVSIAWASAAISLFLCVGIWISIRSHSELKN